MNISREGVALIAAYEGYRSKPYRDSVGIPTIGYGTTVYPDTGRKVTMQDAPVSKEKALGYLQAHVNNLLASWITRNFPGISQPQFDALASFTYNLGTGNLLGSSLGAKIKRKALCSEITKSWVQWNKARVNGKLTVLDGLTRRRIAEANLFCTGKYNS